MKWVLVDWRGRRYIVKGRLGDAAVRAGELLNRPMEPDDPTQYHWRAVHVLGRRGLRFWRRPLILDAKSLKNGSTQDAE